MKIGFIGGGNMGGAIIGGIVGSGICTPDNIIVADINKAGLEAISQRYGVNVTDNNIAAAECDYVFLAVKPNVIFDVISEVKNAVTEHTTVISIAAGRSIESLEAAFGKNIKLIRVMPNTPALVGEGMAALALNKSAEADFAAVEFVLNIFNSLGKSEIVPEKLMDTVTAVSGSSPAYVFMFIEAMADAAVKGGMPRPQAYTFAAQAVLGSAKMVLESDKHPGELKDMVCSPGGTTIEAVAALERCGLRNAVMEAMNACIEKSKNI